MATRILFAGVFALLCLPLLLLPADPNTLESLGVASLLQGDEGLVAALSAAREEAEAGQPAPAVHPLDPNRKMGYLQLDWTGPEGGLDERIDALRTALQLKAEDVRIAPGRLTVPLPGFTGNHVLPLRVAVDHEGGWVRLEYPDGGVAPLNPDGDPIARPLGSRWSMIPPLVAILLAFLLRSSIPSLFIGVLVGSFLLIREGDAIWSAFQILFYDIVYKKVLVDSFHLYILGFVVMLSATVAVISRMGGIEGMVQALVRYAKSSRSVQAVSYCLGIGIFFDDYANTIVVGNSSGPLFDRMKVSRAKLAYIVDSTAAPVAGVALLSTWVAYQISTYAPQLETIGRKSSEGYSIFLETIPYRFYCLLALIMVGLTIFMRRDVGPMAKIEDRARAGEIGPSDSSGSMGERVGPKEGVPPRWFNGVLPLLTMILGTFVLIVYYGADSLQIAAAEGDADAQAAIAAGGTEWFRAVLFQSDSTASIFYGSLAAFLLAGALSFAQRLLSPIEFGQTAARGIGILFKDAILILVLAWSIGKVCSELATANYLVAVFQDLMDPAWLPIVLFLTACFVAFSTGSSWTTMAILQPNVVLLADRLGDGTPLGREGLLVLSIGAVLEGAIFGDHCSPISDTTILSSTASRCNHIEHVRTQAPYALLVAAVALLVGYVPTALFHVSPYLMLPLGIVCLIVLLRVLGRPPKEPAPSAT